MQANVWKRNTYGILKAEKRQQRPNVPASLNPAEMNVVRGGFVF